MATFDYDPKSGTLTLVCKVAETTSAKGNPQLSLAEPYTAFRGGRPVAEATDAAGKRYPLFGSFSIGLAEIVDSTPVVSRNVNTQTPAASASVDIASIVATAVQAALAAQTQTTAVAVKRGVGRPRKVVTS